MCNAIFYLIKNVVDGNIEIQKRPRIWCIDSLQIKKKVNVGSYDFWYHLCMESGLPVVTSFSVISSYRKELYHERADNRETRNKPTSS